MAGAGEQKQATSTSQRFAYATVRPSDKTALSGSVAETAEVPPLRWHAATVTTYKRRGPDNCQSFLLLRNLLLLYGMVEKRRHYLILV